MKKQLAIGAALAAAVALGATIAAFGNAQSSKPGADNRAPSAVFASSEEDEIRAIVREYLLEHPEVIIESLQAYDTRQREAADVKARETARQNLPTLLSDEGGYTVGADPAKAKVAVIELFDYHCTYCKHAMGLVQDLTRKDAAVKVVFREFPILREESEFAAKAALAARAQGKYADMHFAMMGASGVLDKKRIREIAEKNGVDYAALEKAAQDPAIDKALDETHRIAAEMGVEGTPAFIIASIDGGYIEVVPGYSEQHVKAAIDEAKKAAKKK